MFKKSKIVVAILLVMLVSFSSFAVALANDGENEGATPASGPGVLPLIKDLRMPQGTLTPEAGFVFNTTLVSVDGITDQTQLTNAPDLGTFRIKFDAETVALAPGSDTKIATDSIANILAGVTFPHAGEFIFDIWEESDTNSHIDNDHNMVLTYSNYVYRIQVLVSNDDNNGVAIAHIYMIRGIRGDDGTVVFDEGTKVDQLVFTNDFIRTNGPTDPDRPVPGDEDGSTLFVSKTVTGDSGRRDLYFNFNISVTLPTLLPENLRPGYFRAFIVENGAVVQDITSNAVGTTGNVMDVGPYLQISTTSATNFNLKHGQRLVFVDTPVGTSYNVTETFVDGYTTAIEVVSNSVQVLNVSGLTANLTTGTQFVGESNNNAAFTNDRPFTAPMGLGLNDLPFIGLILLAIGAFVGFVVVKVRRSRKSF